MKTTFISLVALMVATGIFLMQGPRITDNIDQSGGIYPDTVRKVIDKKCYGCHSVKGKSQDAKDALMWDSIPNLARKDLVATLDKIIEVLDENKMPPEEIIKKYPEAKLLPGEKKLLKSWAEAKADSIMK